ncbi:fluoride efflux transporter FluC [Streptomyces sp. NPDC086549]|uniref:fluoride efflux transporter FluC n=1 Tax=Streptomyces sp. NPDC086549 TaxID=3365752 RepID=UPI00380FD2EC
MADQHHRFVRAGARAGASDGPRRTARAAGAGRANCRRGIDAYTTFSTFSYELVRLREKGQVRKFLLYGASTLAVGLLAATAEFATGSF